MTKSRNADGWPNPVLGEAGELLYDPETCPVRNLLDRVGDKWSVLVITLLGEGPRRFMALKRSIDLVSQRMLTRTLRGLERDGLVERTVYPTVPPQVEYALTDLGRSLHDALSPLATWAYERAEDVEDAREAYDSREPAAVRPSGCR